MDIGIVGAGITGLSAAYDLTRLGHSVTVYESRPQPGGLASGFRDPQWDWSLERFYHHWFASDQDAIRLIEDIGARDRLFFPRPITSIYHHGEVYPFDSPLRVLQFKPVSLIDRFRVGVVTLYIKLLRDWRPLEKIGAEAWMRRAVGERAYDVLWKPMLVSKFGEEYYRDVNMAWFWARLHKRTPRLGYFVGGFQGFADLLTDKVQSQKGTVLLNTPVHSIHSSEEGVQLETPTGATVHQRVIATCSPHELRRLAPEISGEYAAQLDSLKSMGAVVLILALKHRLTRNHYWINIPAGQDMPFMGLVEHTNYISREHYGDDHLVYCGDYLPPDHPFFEYSKEELIEEYLPGITNINPEFDQNWVRASWMFTEKYAQPVPTLSHSKNIPPLRTPIPGLWMANMSQVYPWDRGSNYAIEMGRRVAREVTA